MSFDLTHKCLQNMKINLVLFFHFCTEFEYSTGGRYAILLPLRTITRKEIKKRYKILHTNSDVIRMHLHVQRMYIAPFKCELPKLKALILSE